MIQMLQIDSDSPDVFLMKDRQNRDLQVIVGTGADPLSPDAAADTCARTIKVVFDLIGNPFIA